MAWYLAATVSQSIVNFISETHRSDHSSITA
jgi:hypothetical protein